MSIRVCFSLVLASILPACGGGGGGAGTDTDPSTSGADTDQGTDGSTVGVGTADDTSGNSGDSTDEGDTEGETGDEVDWTYSEFDSRGRPMIDHLWLFTPQAVSEIEGSGETPASFIEGRLDELNAVLDRSLVTSSRVRSLGYHLLLEEDFARTGVWPGATNDNLGNAPSWLGDYATTYGADKFMIVAGTTESGDGANWGGWVGSSYYVTFLAVTHEVGHTMGGSHCNDGAEGYHFGMPLAGYDESGTPNPPGLSGGTAMCGNSIPFYSNPDLEFSLAEIEDLVSQDLLPDQDYAGALGETGTLRLGDSARANMAQTWRDNEEAAATQTLAARYPGYEDDGYDDADCAGFYTDEGYQDLAFELCAGMEQQSDADLADIRSVRLGANVHVNLYSDADFGAGSTCGGVVNRLAFSSPSLDALAEHWGLESLAGTANSIMVYAPTDRSAHARFEGGFDFYGSGGALPYCATVDGETLTLIRDEMYWVGAAALQQGELDPPYTIEFDYLNAHINDEHGDGLVVFFGKDGTSYATTPPPRESLGFIPDGSGYGVVFNDYLNQTVLVDGNYANFGMPANQDNYTDGAWVPIRVEVTADQVDAYWDGALVVSEALPAAVGSGRVGVSAGTGAYASEFSVRNFSVTPG